MAAIAEGIAKLTHVTLYCSRQSQFQTIRSDGSRKSAAPLPNFPILTNVGLGWYILIYTSVLSQTYFCSPLKLAPSNDLWLYLVKICFQFGSWNMDQMILPTQIFFAVKHFTPLESKTPAQQFRKKKKWCCIVAFPFADNFSLAFHLAISRGSWEILLHIGVTYGFAHMGLNSQLVIYACWMAGLGHCPTKRNLFTAISTLFRLWNLGCSPLE